MTPINELRLFGWTEDQYTRAAQSCGLAFDDDWFPDAYTAVMCGYAISNPAISALQNIKRAWLRRGGPLEGPSGAILLSAGKD